MGNVKKIKKGEMSEFQNKQMEFVADILEMCKDRMIDGDSSLVVGALATSMATVMASMLCVADKDAAMDCINELLNDVRKGTFAQIDMIEKMAPD